MPGRHVLSTLAVGSDVGTCNSVRVGTPGPSDSSQHINKQTSSRRPHTPQRLNTASRLSYQAAAEELLLSGPLSPTKPAPTNRPTTSISVPALGGNADALSSDQLVLLLRKSMASPLAVTLHAQTGPTVTEYRKNFSRGDQGGTGPAGASPWVSTPPSGPPRPRNIGTPSVGGGRPSTSQPMRPATAASAPPLSMGRPSAMQHGAGGTTAPLAASSGSMGPPGTPGPAAAGPILSMQRLAIPRAHAPSLAAAGGNSSTLGSSSGSSGAAGRRTPVQLQKAVPYRPGTVMTPEVLIATSRPLTSSGLTPGAGARPMTANPITHTLIQMPGPPSRQLPAGGSGPTRGHTPLLTLGTGGSGRPATGAVGMSGPLRPGSARAPGAGGGAAAGGREEGAPAARSGLVAAPTQLNEASLRALQDASTSEHDGTADGRIEAHGRSASHPKRGTAAGPGDVPAGKPPRAPGRPGTSMSYLSTQALALGRAGQRGKRGSGDGGGSVNGSGSEQDGDHANAAADDADELDSVDLALQRIRYENQQNDDIVSGIDLLADGGEPEVDVLSLSEFALGPGVSGRTARSPSPLGRLLAGNPLSGRAAAPAGGLHSAAGSGPGAEPGKRVPNKQGEGVAAAGGGDAKGSIASFGAEGAAAVAASQAGGAGAVPVLNKAEGQGQGASVDKRPARRTTNSSAAMKQAAPMVLNLEHLADSTPEVLELELDHMTMDELLQLDSDISSAAAKMARQRN